MKKTLNRLGVWLLIVSLLMSMMPAVSAVPSSTEIITTATGYTKASDVPY